MGSDTAAGCKMGIRELDLTRPRLRWRISPAAVACMSCTTDSDGSALSGHGLVPATQRLPEHGEKAAWKQTLAQ